MLLDNPHACEIVMAPSHSVGEERRERDVKELERIAASWSEADRETVKSQQAALDAWQGTADRPEALAALPRLSLPTSARSRRNIRRARTALTASRCCATSCRRRG